MDKIQGKIINSKEELDYYFDNIYDILNILLISGIRYNDYNINNFIIENITDNVYIIDFEDATKVTMYESINGLSLHYSKMQIKNMLLTSIYTNQDYRII